MKLTTELYPGVVTKDLKIIKEQLKLASAKDQPLIQDALDAIEQRNPLRFKEYEKLVKFSSQLIKGAAADQNHPFSTFKKALQSVGHKAVMDQFVLPNGRMPNASLMVTFNGDSSNPKNETHYVYMIRNGKFHEYTTPEGKIDKADAAVLQDGTIDIEQTYIKAALREFCEEALNPSAQK